MKRLLAIIVDDEPLARERLRRMLKNESDIEIVAEAKDGQEALEAVTTHQPDLLFADIQMPPPNGLELLQKLESIHQPYTIFTTAHTEHAVEAFELNAHDYLLKPFSAERLAKALNRARKQLCQAASENIKPPSGRFVAHSGNRTSYIDPKSIDWVEAAGNYVTLHVGEKNWMLRATMTQFEKELCENPQFMRVSRSAIVNLKKVAELKRLTSKKKVLLLSTGQEIPLTIPTREFLSRQQQPS